MSLSPRAIQSPVLDELHASLFARKTVLLHYDAAAQTLAPYRWPLSEQGQPIDRSKLEEHRTSHVFTYPGCLCAAISKSAIQTESSLFVVSNGDRQEYHANCAVGLCGYSVNIFYRPGYPVFRFPQREQLPVEYAPSILVAHGLEILADVASQQHLASRPVGGGGAGCPRLLDAIPLIPPPSLNVPSPASMIYRLHCSHRPGLTSEQFRSTFVYCECGVVSTHRKHALHKCDYARLSSSEDISISDDAEVLNMLYRLDMTGNEMRLEVFEKIMARCGCGLVMTKLRFPIHECHSKY